MMEKTPDAVAGFQNSGGMRADFPKGDITLGDVISTFPFNNDLIEMDLTGRDLKSLMTHATNLTNGVLQVSKSVAVVMTAKNTQPTVNTLSPLTANPWKIIKHIVLPRTPFVPVVVTVLKHF